MAKTKTLKRRKTLSKNMLQIKKNMGLVAYSPTQNLLDEDLIGSAIWECLKKGDSEGVTEVVVAYLVAKNSSRKIFTRSIKQVIQKRDV